MAEMLLALLDRSVSVRYRPVCRVRPSLPLFRRRMAPMAKVVAAAIERLVILCRKDILESERRKVRRTGRIKEPLHGQTCRWSLYNGLTTSERCLARAPTS